VLRDRVLGASVRQISLLLNVLESGIRVAPMCAEVGDADAAAAAAAGSGR
jgi:hypothetical protein